MSNEQGVGPNDSTENGKALEGQVDERQASRLKTDLVEYARIMAYTLLVAVLLKVFVIDAYHIPTGSMENTIRAGDFLLVNKFVYGAKSPRRFPFTDISVPFFSLPSLKRPERGDVVVFESPVRTNNSGRNVPIYVKRCVGLPGDTIRILEGVLYVNGMPLPLPASARREKHIPLPSGYVDGRIFPRGAPFSADNYGPLVVPYQGMTVRTSVSTLEMWGDFIRNEGHQVGVLGDRVIIDGSPVNQYIVGRNYYFMMGDNRNNSLDSRFLGFVPEELIVGKAMLIYWSWDEGAGQESLLGRLTAIRWNRIGSLVQ
jgi:signal peptidase I